MDGVLQGALFQGNIVINTAAEELSKAIKSLPAAKLQEILHIQSSSLARRASSSTISTNFYYSGGRKGQSLKTCMLLTSSCFTRINEATRTTCMFALLIPKFLHWLNHLTCIEDGWIPKDMLYGVLDTGYWIAGRSILRYIGQPSRIGDAATIAMAGKSLPSRDPHKQAEKRGTVEKMRKCKRQRAKSASTEPGTDYTCSNCNRACCSWIGLFSHKHRP